MLVTDYGMVNPLRQDLLSLPKQASERLRASRYRLFDRRRAGTSGLGVVRVGIVESRDGTILDVIRQIKD
ncbi:MAG: hypothetical protein ACLUOI_16760 [Eisenbergiella sp.]